MDAFHGASPSVEVIEGSILFNIIILEHFKHIMVQFTGRNRRCLSSQGAGPPQM